MFNEATLTTPARARAIAVFVAIALGVWISIRYPGVSAIAWFASAVVASGLVLVRGGRWTIVGLLAGVTMLAAGATTHRFAPPAPGTLGASLDADASQIIELEGMVAGPVRTRELPDDSLRRYLRFTDSESAFFQLRVFRAGGRDASGLVWVGGPVELQALLDAGDTVRLTASVTGIAPDPNPSPLALDRGWRQRQAGVVGRASVRDVSMIERLEPASLGARAGAAFIRVRSSLQERAGRVLGLDASGGSEASEARALLAALVLGERSQDAQHVSEVFRSAGVLHLLSISGFHVAVMAGAALIVVRLTGERGWVEPVLVAALLLAYLMIVPVRAPIVRAGSMALALLLARAVGRRHDPVAVLAWVAVGVIVWRPLELFSLGFQLSFGLVAVLILWSERRAQEASLEMAAGGEIAGWCWRVTREFWGVCVVCWVVATPVILLHAGPVTPYGILASLIATPIAVVLLWGAFGALLVGMVVPSLSAVVTPVLTTIAGWMWAVVSWVEGLPGSSWSAPQVGTLWAVVATAFAVGVVLRGRVRAVWPAAGAGVLAVWLVGGWMRPAGDVALRIDMLAVGDGTCLLVRVDGEALLWDAGSLRPDPRVIERSLLELGVREIDAAIVTHANIDHYVLLPELVERFGIGEVWGGPGVVASGDRAVTRFRELLASRSIEIRPATAGMELAIGGATLRVVSPQGIDSFREENDRSLVAIVEAPTSRGVGRALLTGDVQREGLARLLERGVPRVDVMELPHHGSYVALSAALIESADPWVVLQSTGPQRVGNASWAPSRVGRAWLTTATDGWSWVEIDRDGVVRAGSKLGGRATR